MRFYSTERLRKIKWLFLCVCVITWAVGCATAPTSEPILTPVERIQREQAISAELAGQLESRLKLKQDKEVLVYLRGLAGRLVESSAGFQSSAAGVLVVADRGGRWKDYGIPGNRVYLSSGLLKVIDYENQLAAAMAVEFAHIRAEHVIERLQHLKRGKDFGRVDPADFPSIEGLIPSATANLVPAGVDLFSPTGVYAYPDEYRLDAVPVAVEILYSAGYDARGLVSLWEIYRAHPANSPYEDDLLRKLIEKTRAAIAEHSPLRNPIVRSQAFLAIQKRMRNL